MSDREALLTVATIMTPEVMRVSMDASIGAAARVLQDQSFHHLVVEDDAGRVVGVLSDRDLLRTISPFVGTSQERAMDEFTANRRVHQIMSRNVISATPETPIATVSATMVEKNIHCLPVFDGGGALVGIVTADDVMRWTATQLGYGFGRSDAA